MADLHENQLRATMTPAYLRGIDAGGNSVLISFEELKALMFFNYRIVDNVDANTLTNPGAYYLRSGITNAAEWSLMFVFSFGYNTALWQELVSIGGYNRKFRICSEGSWTSWRSISITV